MFVGGTILANQEAPTANDQSKPAPSNRSLDDELLKSLESAPLSESSQEKKGQGAAAADKEQSTKGDRASSLDNQLLDDLGGEDLGRASESQNPLVRIERKMRTVEKRLADGDLDRQTADLQRQILDELAQFTQQCKAACKSGDGASKPKPGAGSKAGSTAGHAPATTLPRDSSTQLKERDTQLGDRRTAADALKESWGHLPERFRDQLAAPPGDEVLPKYEAMLKKYFQRLAEDDSTGS
jgi:hypothetical protein